MRFENEFIGSTDLSYDEYKNNLAKHNSDELIKQREITVCDELVAVIEERVRYSDRKLFDMSGRFYKPVDIVVHATRIRPQFLGLAHAEDETDADNMLITPIEAVELMSALEGFVGNTLDTSRTYRRSSFSFSVQKRDKNLVLCIDYGGGRKKSYMDKCYCRMTASVLRTILSNCDYWL